MCPILKIDVINDCSLIWGGAVFSSTNMLEKGISRMIYVNLDNPGKTFLAYRFFEVKKALLTFANLNRK